MSGKFIVLEGPDGAGKTTQLARLATRLEAQGRRVVRTREPGGTDLGESIREILLSPGTKSMSATAELFLFMAARAELVRNVILPALEADDAVLSDRFMLSSVVYQGMAGGLGIETVQRVGQLATAKLQPDLSVVIDVPPEVGLQRSRAVRKADRMEKKGLAYHRRVRDGFLEAARQSREPLVIVDGTADAEDVADAIWGHVSRVLG